MNLHSTANVWWQRNGNKREPTKTKKSPRDFKNWASVPLREGKAGSWKF